MTAVLFCMAMIIEMADNMKSYGYASCYDDVSDIIEQLAAKMIRKCPGRNGYAGNNV